MPASSISRTHYANRYSAHSTFGIEWRRLGASDKAANIRGLCAAFPHRSIIEIGCGDGAIMRELRSFGESVARLEILRHAVEACVSAGLSVEHFDGGCIPRAAKSVDLAILSHVIEHVENPRELLFEAVRLRGSAARR